LFTKHARPRVAEKYPNESMTDITKRLAKLWHKLSDAERRKYETKSENLKKSKSKLGEAPANPLKSKLSEAVVIPKRKKSKSRSRSRSKTPTKKKSSKRGQRPATYHKSLIWPIQNPENLRSEYKAKAKKTLPADITFFEMQKRIKEYNDAKRRQLGLPIPKKKPKKKKSPKKSA